MQIAKMHVVLFGGVVRREGFAGEGLGVVNLIKGSLHFCLPETWGVFHLGSGHLVLTVSADMSEAQRIAEEMETWGDWTFETLAGWRNQIPDLWDRIADIKERYPSIHESGGVEDEALARKIVDARRRSKRRHRTRSQTS